MQPSDELNIPAVGPQFLRIKDSLPVRVIKHSNDKTVCYVQRWNAYESRNVWPVFTQNFWKHYREGFNLKEKE